MRILVTAAALLAFAGMVLGLSVGGRAQTTEASVAAGADLAARWCAACHVVGPAGTGTDIAPSFPDIAERRSADWLRGFLAHPHTQPMAGLDLTTREIEDVVAYMESLDPRGRADPGTNRPR